MNAETIYEQDHKLDYNMPLTPRQKDVYQLLLNYISEKSLKDGDKLPSFKDIAEELGISLKIIQKVISLMNRDGVVQAVPYVGTFITRKQKIEKQPADNKASLPGDTITIENRRVKRVALILPWNTPEIMDNLQRLFQDVGIVLLTFFTPMPNATAMKMQLLAACSHGIDGIICFNLKRSIDNGVIELLERVRRNGIHVITVDNETPCSDTSSNFHFGYDAAFRELCSHLQDQGYRQTHYVTKNNVPDEREKLFAAISLEHGLLNGRRVCIDDNELDHVIRKVGKESLPAALYCDNDFVAIESLKHLRGWSNIPDEIGLVASYDLLLGGRYRLGELIVPTLTTLQYPFTRLAEDVVLAMITEINLGQTATLNEFTKCIRLSLVIRESTCRKNMQRM